MKSSLKLFCIVLISAGLMLPACKKQEEKPAEEEGVVEVAEDEVILDEEQPEEEAEEVEEADVAVEGDTAAEGDATAEGDAAAEGEEKKDEEAKKAKPAPAKPAMTGQVNGSFSAGGITNGKLDLRIKDDYSVSGTIKGQSEGRNFVAPIKGKVAKDNSLTASGKRGQVTFRMSGKVNKNSVFVTINGKVNGKAVNNARVTIKK